MAISFSLIIHRAHISNPHEYGQIYHGLNEFCQSVNNEIVFLTSLHSLVFYASVCTTKATTTGCLISFVISISM